MKRLSVPRLLASILGWSGWLALLPACSTVHPEPVEPDRDAYTILLARHVDAEGGVDYAGVEMDRDILEAAYAEIAAASPDSHPDRFPSSQDRLAYWIDAYNIAVLKGVLEEHVRETVMEVSSPFPLSLFAPEGAGFFYFTRFLFGGESYSLYSLEHDVIRDRFGEPRIHFAINCASQSCPRLENRPYRGADLEDRLQQAALEFVADVNHVRVDSENRTVWLSALLDWFAEDFGNPLAYVAELAVGHKGEQLQQALSEDWAVKYLPYDWSLNGHW